VEFISGQATAPGATITALTMNDSDSATIRQADPTKRNYILSAFAQLSAPGMFRIRSPRMHDANQGIRLRVPSANLYAQYPLGMPQIVYPTDRLTLEITGSAVGGHIEQAGLLVFYEDLGGVAAQLMAPADVAKAPFQIMAQEVAITAGALGGYSGAAAVNSSFDNWQANRYYALLGGEVDTDVLAVTIRGVDTGNVRMAFPGNSVNKAETRNWFWHLSNAYGIPLIPKFAANNRASITVEVVADQTAPMPVVTLFFVLLP